MSSPSISRMLPVFSLPIIHLRTDWLTSKQACKPWNHTSFKTSLGWIGCLWVTIKHVRPGNCRVKEGVGSVCLWTVLTRLQPGRRKPYLWAIWYPHTKNLQCNWSGMCDIANIIENVWYRQYYWECVISPILLVMKTWMEAVAPVSRLRIPSSV